MYIQNRSFYITKQLFLIEIFKANACGKIYKSYQEEHLSINLCVELVTLDIGLTSLTSVFQPNFPRTKSLGFYSIKEIQLSNFIQIAELTLIKVPALP